LGYFEKNKTFHSSFTNTLLICDVAEALIYTLLLGAWIGLLTGVLRRYRSIPGTSHTNTTCATSLPGSHLYCVSLMFFYLQQFCLELALIDNGNASPESDVGRHIFCHRATEQLFISLATITELVLRLEHPSVRSSAIQSILHSVSQNALDSLG